MRITAVNEAVMGQMLATVDTLTTDSEKFAAYIEGVVAGVAIAQGRATKEVLESFLSYARKRVVYEDIVHELEMLYDAVEA